MKYKLISDSKNDVSNVIDTVLKNRGVRDKKAYLNLTSSCLYDYHLLDNIERAVDLYVNHISVNNPIHILVDCDTDGYTSAASLYSYTKKVNPYVPITYSIHQKKEHGLSKDIEIPKETKLLIIPDAGSNDVDQCKKLSEHGVDILVLDHHQCDIKNPYALVVNNQLCGYPNKQLCGAGVVYKFLQAVDDKEWQNYADCYLDLVALGLIGDNMDVRSLETRYLIDKGMSHVRNKFLKQLIKRQMFTLGDNYTSKDIQFIVVPLINAMIRAGDFEEKDLMFRAFVETDEQFEHKGKQESIYERAARLCLNAKNRQKSYNNSVIPRICKQIERWGQDQNKIIISNVTKYLDQNMTGVVTIKIADYYNKPCLLLREKNDGLFGGSGRNINGNSISDLKKFLTDLHLFEMVTGHPNAFGVEIRKENILKAIQVINQKLKDVDFEKYILADFIISEEDLTISLVKDIWDLRRFFGPGFDEPVIIVEHLLVYASQFSLMGKNNNNWKIITDEGITLIKFHIDENDALSKAIEQGNSKIKLTIAGRANLNNYKGILTSQLIIMDYQIDEVV